MAAALFAAALLAGCSTQPAAAPAQAGTRADGPAPTHPVSGLPIIPVAVSHANGRTVFRSEVAASAQEQAQGLMFRTALGPDEAMIFPRSDGAPASFWMKNTPIPLDIVFVGPDRRILNIAAMTVPYSLDPVPSDGPVSAVFEIAGGRAAELGLAPGDRIEWTLPPGTNPPS